MTRVKTKIPDAMDERLFDQSIDSPAVGAPGAPAVQVHLG